MADKEIYFSVFIAAFDKQANIRCNMVVFQGCYPRVITMQPIRQLQWTDTKTTS